MAKRITSGGRPKRFSGEGFRGMVSAPFAAVSRVLFRKRERELTEFCGKLGEFLSGTADSQRDSRESIRANHSQLKPLFL